MSHYAKIVEPIEGWILGMPAKLPIDTLVKRVKIPSDVDGGYECFASQSGGKTWVRFFTQADLPAFTDTGRAHRAKHPRVTMQRGRPTKSNEPPTKTITIRLRNDQRAALGDGYGKKVVDALVAQGLVPR